MMPLTDRVGQPLLPSEYLTEPLPGSVVLTNGLHGTAWQRHFTDGLWHRTGSNPSRPKTWEWFLTQRNLVLIYNAEPRHDPVQAAARIQRGPIDPLLKVYTHRSASQDGA